MHKANIRRTLCKAFFSFLLTGAVFAGALNQPIHAQSGTVYVQAEQQDGEVAKLTVNTKSVKLKKGATQQLALTATYKNGTSADVTALADWSSSDNELARVEAGLVTAVDSGKVKVYANYKGKKVTIPVEIDVVSKLAANEKKLTLRAGAAEKLTITATYSDKTKADVTELVEWTAQESGIVQIEKGTVTAIGSGKTKITAKYAGKSVTIPVEVDLVSKLELSAKKLSLRQAETEQLTLNAVYSDKTKTVATESAEWTTENIAVATVEKGVVKAVGSGKTKITAKYGGKTVTIPVEVDLISKLTVDPTRVTMKAGETKTLTAMATYSDKSSDAVTDKAEWTSADKTVASIEGGVITAQKAGKTTILVTYGGKIVKVSVTVK
ncbi:Ig-like domain-containing protein [Brevibacillus migulae]|uniref:Ig-like domain-containing protein n=1 Tax=Brevibacillus migulae TaxID=1644114 RepID=UPI00106EAA78|nr:Ig-like domain-containing protein [Brevibacillus migulae]